MWYRSSDSSKTAVEDIEAGGFPPAWHPALEPHGKFRPESAECHYPCSSTQTSQLNFDAVPPKLVDMRPTPLTLSSQPSPHRKQSCTQPLPTPLPQRSTPPLANISTQGRLLPNHHQQSRRPRLPTRLPRRPQQTLHKRLPRPRRYISRVNPPLPTSQPPLKPHPPSSLFFTQTISPD